MNKYDKLNLNTGIIGILGHPIKHSFSPLMHNIAFELNKLNFIYLPFDVPQSGLKDAVRGMVALGFKGFNITLPYKETIIPHLKNVSEEASMIGAVNTVVNENGVLYGYNTDVNGVYETLLPYKDDLAGKQVSILGAGGASRSVIYTLIRHFKPEKINIINRNFQKAESLKDYFTAKTHFNGLNAHELYPPDLKDVLKKSKLIVNTTSVGIFPNVDDSVLTEYEHFSNDQIVFDVIYNPVRTKLLMLADAAGAEVLDGLKMFVYQGAKAFELWTGQEMPVEKIMKTLRLYISTD